MVVETREKTVRPRTNSTRSDGDTPVALPALRKRIDDPATLPGMRLRTELARMWTMARHDSVGLTPNRR